MINDNFVEGFIKTAKKDIASKGASLIKSPKYKVNEVMKAAPKNKRDDILRELRKSKK